MALKEICVDFDVLNFRVWVVIGEHRHLAPYVRKRHRRVYKGKATAHAAGLYFNNRGTAGGILWLAKPPRTPQTIGYLAHEMGHAVMDLHSQQHINLDSLNDETFCYSIAHGVQKVLEGIRK